MTPLKRELRLAISDAVLKRFPEVQVGGFLIRGMRAAIHRLAEPVAGEAIASLAAQGIGVENLSSEPRIREWRKAIGACGLKPSTYKSSPEQLASRVLRGKTISTSLPLVNLYTDVGIRHLTPAGGYDLERLPADAVELREARAGDSFRPLGAGSDSMPLSPSVVVYASASEVLCWAFNHRDSAVTCLRSDTNEALFLAEAVAEVHEAPLHAALDELSQRLRDSGAKVGAVDYLDARRPEMLLTI